MAHQAVGARRPSAAGATPVVEGDEVDRAVAASVDEFTHALPREMVGGDAGARDHGRDRYGNPPGVPRGCFTLMCVMRAVTSAEWATPLTV